MRIINEVADVQSASTEELRYSFPLVRKMVQIYISKELQARGIIDGPRVKVQRPARGLYR